MKDIKMSIRFPAQLREWIEDRSIRNHRSMNNEIVAILSAIRESEEIEPNFKHFGNHPAPLAIMPTNF